MCRAKECGVGVSLCSDVYDVNLYARRQTRETQTIERMKKMGTVQILVLLLVHT